MTDLFSPTSAQGNHSVGERVTGFLVKIQSNQDQSWLAAELLKLEKHHVPRRAQ